jgi:hypothetical protein
VKVDDGTRTRDRLDHNQELYQLSYVHRAGSNLAGGGLEQLSEGFEAHCGFGDQVLLYLPCLSR